MDAGTGVAFFPQPASVNTSAGNLSRAADIPQAKKISTGLWYLASDTAIPQKAWKLADLLIVEISIEEHQYVAKSLYLDEYGIGPTVMEAIADLLVSLVDYMESLQRREMRLSDPLKEALAQLRRLLAHV